MIVSGKIYSISNINDDITNIVLIKSRNKKEYFISILFYFHLSDVVKVNYFKSDFVKIWFRLRSNKRVGVDNKPKFYTDIIGEKIVLVKRNDIKIKRIKNEFGMEEKHRYYVEDTGEVIPQHSVKGAIRDNPNRI
jgi:hypothetical protein|tara:strand:+ start:1473 stop:1877 length:405 start_codon:yes stop_codon:yes gene_type:complete